MGRPEETAFQAAVAELDPVNDHRDVEIGASSRIQARSWAVGRAGNQHLRKDHGSVPAGARHI